jgi:hypothetical protein
MMFVAPIISFCAWWIALAHYSSDVEPLIGSAMMLGMAASAWAVYQQTRWW